MVSSPSESGEEARGIKQYFLGKLFRGLKGSLEVLPE